MKSTIKTATNDRAPTATATYHSRPNRAMTNEQGMQDSQAPSEERRPKVAPPAAGACKLLAAVYAQPAAAASWSPSDFTLLGARGPQLVDLGRCTRSKHKPSLPTTSMAQRMRRGSIGRAAAARRAAAGPAAAGSEEAAGSSQLTVIRIPAGRIDLLVDRFQPACTLVDRIQPACTLVDHAS
jgi:hypothetical protein